MFCCIFIHFYINIKAQKYLFDENTPCKANDEGKGENPQGECNCRPHPTAWFCKTHEITI